jgi:aldehyde dehydrogenase (NAD+)/retinal dehydrogenase
METAHVDLPQTFTKFYLNGEYVDPISTETFIVRNPKDNSLVADKVPVAGVEDVDRAVQYAEDAFNGPWSTFTAMQRAECLRNLVQLLEERLTDILTLDSLTTGNPVSLIPTREKNYIKNCLLYYGNSTPAKP